ncbi:hypothetical protein BGZ73_004206 [Actinomortierella ambigua]|nr:hypothetical protein BGZ73_004206 [Actinomortierella ambigua]
MAMVATAAARGTPLTQARAEALLTSNGITASSTGGCTDKNNSNCTSYEGILSGTVDAVITLKKASGCPSLIITGATETGHGVGVYSHANGYKVDLRKMACLNNYIKNTFTKIGNRSDGYPQWKAPSGNIYCDEGNHWDIVIY